MRTACLPLLLAALGYPPPQEDPRSPRPPEGDAYHVHPGEEIQAAVDAAADDPAIRRVVVHAGTYRPARIGQALVALVGRHDGIHLVAEGEVILTAIHAELTDPRVTGHPAAVNHVVYFGDGIGPETTLSGFTITGARGFVVDAPVIEPSTEFRKDLFFVADGGGIKIFGRSYPTIENVIVEDNYASPCGGGVSVQHEGLRDRAVVFRNCIFRNNRCQMTGAAVDLLPGSAAELINCLFVGNVSNTGFDYVTLINGRPLGTNIKHSGVLTIFKESRAVLRRCTFVGNRNGVDDRSPDSRFEQCLFWDNRMEGGLYPTAGFDLSVPTTQGIHGCFFAPETVFSPEAVLPPGNRMEALDPDFDAQHAPRHPDLAEVGYRPVPPP